MHFIAAWFPDNPLFLALSSVILNLIVAISGILPSTFITVGTVGVFGLEKGLFILICGEALGAIVSFILYRKGVQKFLSFPKMGNIQNKYLAKLRNSKGMTTFFIVVLLRILPFVSSGAVTLTAALSKMSLLSFCFASTLGKIPALFIEAYSVSHVLRLEREWQIGFIVFVIIILLIYLFYKKRMK